MKTLQDHVQVPINNPYSQLVYAPNEPLPRTQLPLSSTGDANNMPILVHVA
ncbi:hypothetical protein F441_09253 [Phytophthora nicotianae CJ01A1]|uniref:Uncharacterized protein n=2 Tax=Phytophthora nicotianae TaxID=4792 RepID=W2X2J8_PHYNI|nr:hypothetical protein L916_09026 [Phytophthora nicotianae]ETP16119.1 hypothetical protein F441_09253 [Phytophthora nicotianae CJ01A1]